MAHLRNLLVLLILTVGASWHAVSANELIANELIIDASSSQAYRNSVMDVKIILGAQSAARFTAASQKLIGQAKENEPAGTSKDELIKKVLHGKTADQIIKEAFPE